MTKEDMVHEIGAMLLDDRKIQSRKPWKHLVVAVHLESGSAEAAGFVYKSDGSAVPTSPANFRVLNKFVALRDAMREPGKEAWKAALVRIDDPSLHITIDFEYDHPEKWLIGASNVDEMAEKLRPAS